MADDARTQFVDGLRVTAEHLQHQQDRLRDAVRDLRRMVGTGRIAWGLRLTEDADRLVLSEGVAFAPSGIRLAVDAPMSVEVPPGGPWRVVLTGANADVPELRIGNIATVVYLHVDLSLEPWDAVPGPDALTIGTVTDGAAASPPASGFIVEQDERLFAATGHHAHSGESFQDAEGRWHYDGALIEGAVGPPGPEGEPGLAGEPGPEGPQGLEGPVGPAGPQGEPGPAGADGAVGPEGPAGADGAVGPEGPPGPEGPAGADGADGAPGSEGPAGSDGADGADGAIGPEGPAGPPGPPGPSGLAGADGESGPEGPQGSVGPEGPAGPEGPIGPEGRQGPAGAQGLRGPAGADGAQGAIGPIGPQGPEGPEGPQGVDGPRGPAGPAGPGLDPNWPIIAEVNWPHEAVVPRQQAVEILRRLEIRFSDLLDDVVLERRPNFMQVWLEPLSAIGDNFGGAVRSLGGKVVLFRDSAQWQIGNGEERAITEDGTRVLIRIHCGYLFDDQRRPFSSSTDGIIRFQSPRAPGGVLESWFFVTRAP